MGNSVRGFSKASTVVVGVPLSTVTLEQAARLVTVGRAPTLYLNDSERLMQQSEALAQRAKNAL
jgi:membrane peptidoglycan carboxypeptidase